MLSDPLLPSGPKLDMLSLQCCVAELVAGSMLQCSRNADQETLSCS